ncbi:DUF342 domain-containing protein [Geobacter argillaceus]|uniref:Flagellar Assembly Protein A N-terminal region domain-containing protein n=1 Tax=Geobacter argillaceus TaxID=345631 RepID=A0A562VIW8_9BACT|nr:FapA family protein [Geobacter argillaceus]TWJ17734.1 hypothetical protein JN12_02851 [Geobacter argillaceus]
MADDSFIKEEEKIERLEFKRLGYTLVLEVSADELACLCTYEPNEDGKPLTAEELEDFLAQARIREGVIEEGGAALLDSAASKNGVAGLLLAKGEPMSPGEDGKIVLEVAEDSADEARGSEDTSIVDMRQVQEFINVNADDLIARVLPPGEGTAGRTIRARTIPPQPGKPLDLHLGSNVRFNEEDGTVYAIAAGRVYCQGADISVEETYLVKGDVDFKVGNIEFNGFVEIRGDVLDGFTVKATKGVKVHGNIEACLIESGGNVSFCGMSGQGKGVIRCGGSIAANFVYDATIDATGDLLADTEIRNCQIRTLGAVRVGKRGMAGGECVALAGVDAGSLGAVSSLRTHIIAGVHYGDQEEITRLFNELKEVIARFNATQKTASDLKEFQTARAAVTARTHEVRSRQHEATNPKINVRKMLYDGVTITLGSYSETIREERKGPMSIIENTIESGLRFLGLTELSIKAQDIESAFVEQQKLGKYAAEKGATV